jgi:hypothetical protein
VKLDSNSKQWFLFDPFDRYYDFFLSFLNGHLLRRPLVFEKILTGFDFVLQLILCVENN